MGTPERVWRWLYRDVPVPRALIIFMGYFVAKHVVTDLGWFHLFVILAIGAVAGIVTGRIVEFS